MGATSDHQRDMLGRTSLALLVALPLKKPGGTNGEAINAFGGSWFAVSRAGAKVAPRSQPQGGGGYGGGY